MTPETTTAPFSEYVVLLLLRGPKKSTPARREMRRGRRSRPASGAAFGERAAETWRLHEPWFRQAAAERLKATFPGWKFFGEVLSTGTGRKKEKRYGYGNRSQRLDGWQALAHGSRRHKK